MKRATIVACIPLLTTHDYYPLYPEERMRYMPVQTMCNNLYGYVFDDETGPSVLIMYASEARKMNMARGKLATMKDV